MTVPSRISSKKLSGIKTVGIKSQSVADSLTKARWWSAKGNTRKSNNISLNLIENWHKKLEEKDKEIDRLNKNVEALSTLIGKQGESIDGLRVTISKLENALKEKNG